MGGMLADGTLLRPELMEFVRGKLVQAWREDQQALRRAGESPRGPLYSFS